MLFKKEQDRQADFVVVIRDDHDGRWILVHDPEHPTHTEELPFSGDSWMQLDEALREAQIHYVVTLYPNEYEAQQGVARMVARWGLGTIGGEVNTRKLVAVFVPGHYECNMNTSLLTD